MAQQQNTSQSSQQQFQHQSSQQSQPKSSEAGGVHTEDELLLPKPGEFSEQHSPVNMNKQQLQPTTQPQNQQHPNSQPYPYNNQYPPQNQYHPYQMGFQGYYPYGGYPPYPNQPPPYGYPYNQGQNQGQPQNQQHPQQYPPQQNVREEHHQQQQYPQYPPPHGYNYPPQQYYQYPPNNQYGYPQMYPPQQDQQQQHQANNHPSSSLRRDSQAKNINDASSEATFGGGRGNKASSRASLNFNHGSQRSVGIEQQQHQQQISPEEINFSPQKEGDHEDIEVQNQNESHNMGEQSKIMNQSAIPHINHQGHNSSQEMIENSQFGPSQAGNSTFSKRARNGQSKSPNMSFDDFMRERTDRHESKMFNTFAVSFGRTEMFDKKEVSPERYKMPPSILQVNHKKFIEDAKIQTYDPIKGADVDAHKQSIGSCKNNPNDAIKREPRFVIKSDDKTDSSKKEGVSEKSQEKVVLTIKKQKSDSAAKETVGSSPQQHQQLTGSPQVQQAQGGQAENGN